MGDNLIENIAKLYLFIVIGVIIGIVLSKIGENKIKNLDFDLRDKTSKLATTFLVKIFTPIVIFLTLTTTDYQLELVSIVQIIVLELFTVFFAWITNYYILKKKILTIRELGHIFS